MIYQNIRAFFRMSYHANLNPIVDNIREQLSREIPPQNIELEYKYAFLKFPINDNAFKNLLKSSENKPILINSLKDAKKYKFNAKCQDFLYENALQNLKKISERSKSKIQDYYQLCVIANELKYIYDTVAKQWKIMQKFKLFDRQYNVISKSRLFRLDMSQKTMQQRQKVGYKLKKMLQVVEYRGLLRYKHIFAYPVDEKFSIYTSVIFQTQDYEEINDIRKLITLQGDKIDQEITDKMNAFQKKLYNIKHELELRFTPKGIQQLQKCDDYDLKIVFSQSFNFFRDITMKPLESEQDLLGLMECLSLGQSKPAEQKQEKGEEIAYIVDKK